MLQGLVISAAARLRLLGGRAATARQRCDKAAGGQAAELGGTSSGKSPAKPSGNSPGQASAGGTAQTSAERNLRYAVIHDSVRLFTSDQDWREDPPADFYARCLLKWIAMRHSFCQERWVSSHDIEQLYPIFLGEAGDAAGGRSFLSVARALGQITQKREREYRDLQGRRRTVTEYFVPEAAAIVVEPVEQKRKRA